MAALQRFAYAIVPENADVSHFVFALFEACWTLWIAAHDSLQSGKLLKDDSDNSLNKVEAGL